VVPTIILYKLQGRRVISRPSRKKKKLKTAALPGPSTYLQDCLGKNQTTTHHAKSKAKGNHIIYKHKMQMVYSFSFCFYA
jgi:hypothetical protein